MEQIPMPPFPFLLANAQTLMQSKEAMQLIQLLQNDPAALSKVAEAINQGDSAKAISLLQPLMQSKQAEDLLSSLQKKLG